MADLLPHNVRRAPPSTPDGRSRGRSRLSYAASREGWDGFPVAREHGDQRSTGHKDEYVKGVQHGTPPLVGSEEATDGPGRKVADVKGGPR